MTRARVERVASVAPLGSRSAVLASGVTCALLSARAVAGAAAPAPRGRRGPAMLPRAVPRRLLRSPVTGRADGGPPDARVHRDRAAQPARRPSVPQRGAAAGGQVDALRGGRGVVERSAPRPSGGAHRAPGRDEIRRLLPSQNVGRRLPPGRDSYDMSTAEIDDVITLADGDYVVRQQTFRATTVLGRRYENTYCFVFRFNDAGRDPVPHRALEHLARLPRAVQPRRGRAGAPAGAPGPTGLTSSGVVPAVGGA